MKIKLFVALLAVCLMGATTEDEKSVFTTKDIVWYGLDFTKAKFVGGFNQAGGIGEASGEDMVKKWIPAWNNLIITEQTKYDLKKAFDKESVYYDIKKVNELNSKIDPADCITPNPGAIDPASIKSMVAKYSGDKKEGLGLSFVIESFNKTDVTADVYVVFFDIATKKVLLSEKVLGKPAGIGMRNYWAGAIHDILKKVGSKEYKNWERKNK
jgi:hypothetical protein